MGAFDPTNSWKFLQLDIGTSIPRNLKKIWVGVDIVHIAEKGKAKNKNLRTSFTENTRLTKTKIPKIFSGRASCEDVAACYS